MIFVCFFYKLTVARERSAVKKCIESEIKFSWRIHICVICIQKKATKYVANKFIKPYSQNRSSLQIKSRISFFKASK